MRDDLQELVDEVSRLLAAPATLEDADFTLLAFCAHDDSSAERDGRRPHPLDPDPRLAGGRPAPGSRSSASRPPRRRCARPADPAAGILTRLVIPVRHAGRTRGYLWLLDGGRIDPAAAGDPALAAAVDLAAARRTAARRARRPPTTTSAGRSSAALTGSARGPRAGASGRSARPSATSCRSVLVALVAGPGRPSRALATAERGRGRDGAARRPGGTGRGRARPAGVDRPTSARPGRWPLHPSPELPRGSTAGVSQVRRGVAELPAQWAQARAAARVAASGAAPLPGGALGGAGRLAAGHRAAPDPTRSSSRCSPTRVLTETAEVFLDCAGSASRAAAALQIHRQTLYYRLARIEAAHRPGPGRRRGPAAAARVLKAARLQGAARKTVA